MNKSLISLFCFITLLYGCASKNSSIPDNQLQFASNTAYFEKVSQIKQWKIHGKIAFLQKDKRESANLFWQVNQNTPTQTLKLTTYLGINVLSLTSKEDLHTVEVDGESYQSKDLEQLVYSLTKLTLPTQAFQYWFKGLPFLESDKVTYHQDSNLPTKLSSHYNNVAWQITYSNYRPVNDTLLPHSLSIKQKGLTIKIIINQWKL